MADNPFPSQKAIELGGHAWERDCRQKKGLLQVLQQPFFVYHFLSFAVWR